MAKIKKNVCSGAAEAEIAALFMNATHAVPLTNTLNELGHKQPATPTWTDNSTAHGILNDKVNQNRSKSIDMQFSIGSKTASDKVSSPSNGHQEQPTWRIATRNIIQPNITIK